ncbi:hypothetical protein Y032_0103g3515 [Ancylostoma ceylanicum]|uniref:Uncharacterized protein n=1 Tax=Ancylostoma ceylanicum TaxID=53326 RepID=A0A016TGP1_9BILA|nr:hypothetical protein Y032_0103g3515 [Ancylostoma ceylanicum]
MRRCPLAMDEITIDVSCTVDSFRGCGWRDSGSIGIGSGSAVWHFIGFYGLSPSIVVMGTKKQQLKRRQAIKPTEEVGLIADQLFARPRCVRQMPAELLSRHPHCQNESTVHTDA